MYMPFLYLNALSLLPSHVCMLYLTGFIACWNLIKVTYLLTYVRLFVDNKNLSITDKF